MSLELKKKEHALSKVKVAKEEMEIRILEYQDKIEKIKQNIKIQDQAIEDLKLQIKNYGE